MTDYMLTGLVKRRAEIAGEIEATQKALHKLSADLMTIENAIRLVAPDTDIGRITPKTYRPPHDWSKRGEMRRMTLDVLRVARAPMTSREIAAEILTRRGIIADTAMINLMSKRCNSSLRDARNGGHVRSSEGGAGFWLLWEIAR
jgi:hypothetical protein